MQTPQSVPTKQLLDQARVAYHKLVTGLSPREVVDSNGERVTFTAANRQNLAAYITELEAKLAATTPGGAPLNNHPATFIF